MDVEDGFGSSSVCGSYTAHVGASTDHLGLLVRPAADIYVLSCFLSLVEMDTIRLRGLGASLILLSQKSLVSLSAMEVYLVQ